MDLIQLEIIGISYSQTQTGAYALILSEIIGKRKLPIVIGGFEAQSIAMGIENDITPPRPLTHDLFKNVLNKFEISVKKVIIHKLLDGVFFSKIICVKDKVEQSIDARTSDAVSIAIRFKAPIFTNELILSEAGFSDSKNFQEKKLSVNQWVEKFIDDKSPKDILPSDLSKISFNDLNKLLKKLVKMEDYEGAAKIRDEILKRNKR